MAEVSAEEKKMAGTSDGSREKVQRDGKFSRALRARSKDIAHLARGWGCLQWHWEEAEVLKGAFL